LLFCIFFFSSRRRHTRFSRDWSSDVCSSDLLTLRPISTKSKLPPPPTNAIIHVFDSCHNLASCEISSLIIGSTTSFNIKLILLRSEERRVGKESRIRWSQYHEKKKNKK